MNPKKNRPTVCEKCGCRKPEKRGIVRVAGRVIETHEWILTKFRGKYVCPICLNGSLEEDDQERREYFLTQYRTESPTALFEIEESNYFTAKEKDRIGRNTRKMGLHRTHEQVKTDMFSRRV